MTFALSFLAPAAAVAVVAASARARAGMLGGPVSPSWGNARATAERGQGGWLLALAATLAGLAPMLSELDGFAGRSSLLTFDSASHAAIAQAIATRGVPHGWLDVSNGGFPLGPHYPSVGWLLAAALIRLGAPTVVAVKGLGIAALLATPLAVLYGARAVGARPLSGVVGALALAWVSPYVDYVGGWGAYVRLGLLSQALVMPIIVLWVAALASPRGAAWASLLGALAVATHPQVCGVALIVLVPVAVIGCDAAARGRVVRSAVAATAMGLALYGPGVVAMATPFGWPPNLTWRHLGFPPERIADWIADGDLLDLHSAPAVTGLAIFAIALHAMRLRTRVARALVVAVTVTLLLSVSGHALADAGALGRFLLSFFQPMRALALVPVACAAAIVAAIDVALTSLDAVARRDRLRGLSVVAYVALGFLAWVALPPRFRALHEIAAAQRAFAANDTCTPHVEGWSSSTLAAWIGALADGRFTYDAEEPLCNCATVHGADLASRVPFGFSSGAGAHVGVHAIAFLQVRPERPGSAARAEALGVRTLAHLASRRPDPSEAWAPAAQHGEMELSTRVGGTRTVGVGCVERVLRGREAELRAAVIADVSASPSFLDTPQILTALEATRAPLERATEPRGPCDASRAIVREVDREPGAYEAEVESPSEVDVVVRATAFPTWVVRADGVQLATRRVAPGFVSARVGAGRHRIEAIVSPPRFYVAGLVAALAMVVASATSRMRGRRRG